MFKNIMAPVTPSAYCERSADTAIAFAQRFEANLVLLHVYGSEHRWGEAELLTSTEELEKIRASIAKHFAEKLKGVTSQSIMVTQGVPHVEILRAAREMESDLIVMCPYRKEVAEREKTLWARVGSTMERVAQQAHCPVMLVPRATPYGEHVFRTIVAATDFSMAAGHVVDYAGQMARHYNANLTVLNVLDTDTTARDMTQEGIGREISERKKRMAVEYGGILRDIKACAYECWEGQPAVEILKLARTENADLILMAHQGEADPEKALLGSTVALVAGKATCPVISLNHHFTLG
jgi:nucleotide-binding universal stress UspA family protein